MVVVVVAVIADPFEDRMMKSGRENDTKIPSERRMHWMKALGSMRRGVVVEEGGGTEEREKDVHDERKLSDNDVFHSLDP